jgi:site-specific DNA recombinase
MDRAVGYARVSTQKQEDKYSLPDQVQNIVNHCQQQGYRMMCDVLREVHSGFYLDERPVLSELRDMMAHGLVDVVVVNELDRLSRSQTHLTVFMYIAEKYGVRVENVLGTKWTNDPMGRHILSTLGLVAELERTAISERTQRGRRQRVEQGKILAHNKPPYGYLFDGEDHARFIIDPETAPIVIRIYDDFLSGMTLRDIARQLQDEGRLTPRNYWWAKQGKPIRNTEWDVTTVRCIIKNRKYKGEYRAFEAQTSMVRDHDIMTGEVSLKRKLVFRPEDDPEIKALDGVVPVIIPPEKWEAAVKLLVERRKTAPRSYHRAEETLLRGGYITCGVCGATMNQDIRLNEEGEVKRRRYRCNNHNRVGASQCANSLNADAVDECAWEGIKWVLTHMDDYAAQLKVLSESNAGKRIDETVKALKLQITENDDARAAMRQSVKLLKDPESIAALTDDINELAAQKRALVKELQRAEASREGEDARLSRLKELEMWAESFRQDLDNLPYAGKRMFLRVMGVKAKAWPKGYERRFRLYTHADFESTFFASPVFKGREKAVGMGTCVEDANAYHTAQQRPKPFRLETEPAGEVVLG